MDRVVTATGCYQRLTGVVEPAGRRKPTADDTQSDWHYGGYDSYPLTVHGVAAL